MSTEEKMKKKTKLILISTVAVVLVTIVLFLTLRPSNDIPQWEAEQIAVDQIRLQFKAFFDKEMLKLSVNEREELFGGFEDDEFKEWKEFLNGNGLKPIYSFKEEKAWHILVNSPEVNGNIEVIIYSRNKVVIPAIKELENS